MAQDPPNKTPDPDEHTETAKAEHQDRFSQLLLCDSPLTPDQAALLREYFPTIRASYRALVWNFLRRQPLALATHDIEDLHQETFLALHRRILKRGFPHSIPATLIDLAEKKFLNHRRAKRRTPPVTSYPSSSSEKPTSQVTASRALERRELAQQAFQRLSREHQQVIQMVLLDGRTHVDAAAALGIPEGTLKSRLLAAKRALDALAKAYFPPSQR